MIRIHRPEISVPYLNVTINQQDRVAPGYLFLAPFGSSLSGPLIYDQNGELVWAGGDVYAAEDNRGPHVYNFYPCQYLDTEASDDDPHLCMNRGINDGGTSRGEGLILDSDYQVVRGVRFNGSSPSVDIHEFTLVENGTAAILTQYRPIPADLSAFGIPGVGYIYDCVFQEQRLSDGAILFEWRSSDHVGLDESRVVFFGGTGQSPWDYFHINSIQKADDGSGDYLVSARHTSTVYKISGKDGSIKWRLGGSRSDFTITSDSLINSGSKDPERWFHFQHDARTLYSDGQNEVISLFDNGRTPGQVLDSLFSRGLVIKLDADRRLATIQAEYFTDGQPQNSTLAGSIRGLPNGNTLVGWGKTGCLTEYDGGARPVFEACLLDEGRPALYRVHKSDEWVGHPLGRPSIVSYSKTGTKTALYMSWNGATEIHVWRIFGAEAGGTDDPIWEEILVEPRSGFETVLGPLPRFLESVYAEALDSNGRVVGVSEATKTFVPSELHDDCDDLWCNAMVLVDVEESGLMDRLGIDFESLSYYKWLYPAVLLYIAITFCLAVFTVRNCLWRRRPALACSKGAVEI
ncbi:hypothetical protein KVR01_013696 [Diaporthe batatas]|uniref:uncharacterized protein n=1 Tax=Diaporthe batatas TaxID=748121 RepID=UPI001D04331A|nr:uncharacterized protein KVR01_013696 [Diaporthe batatas]KAG8156462.1 hypothetical protein KVR01_013696 [Diaporthe batatas]